MGIAVDPTEPSSDWLKAAVELVSGGARLASLVAGSAGGAAGLGNLLKAKEALDGKEPTLGQLAWRLWRDSATLALATLLAEEPFAEKAQRGAVQEKDVLGQLIDIGREIAGAEEIDTDLESGHLLRPLDWPFYAEIVKRISELVEGCATGHGQPEAVLMTAYERLFARAFSVVWMRDGKTYQPLEDALDSAAAHAQDRDYQWRRYGQFIERQISEDPIFGYEPGEEGAPTLEDVYVPLRCYTREIPMDIDKRYRLGGFEDSEKLKKITVTVSMLDETLREWALADDKDDLIRIVTGGPGCGKSSAAKMLTRSLLQGGACRAYLIPLQGLDIARKADEIIAGYCNDVCDGGEGLSGNPVDWLGQDPLPLVLVFDGLDEVTPDTGVGHQVFKEFMIELRGWLSRKHSQSNRVMVKAVILGRNQAAEQARDALREQGALLFTAPMSYLGEDVFARDGDLYPIDAVYKKGVSIADQRILYWQKSMIRDGRVTERLPSEYNDPEVIDLTKEPLLFHLLNYSKVMEQRKANGINRNEVYYRIFKEIFERDKNKDEDAVRGSMGENEFFFLMQCLGVSTWIGGGRVGAEAHFKKLRDTVLADLISKDLSERRLAPLGNVAVLTHTQQAGQAAHEISFIHKSFGEYLTARAIIQAFEKWIQLTAKDFCRKWFQLTGPHVIQDSVFNYIGGHVEKNWFKDAEITGKPIAWEYRERLLEVCNYVFAEGFPAHETLELSIDDQYHWNHRQWRVSNASHSLFSLLGCIKYYARNVEEKILDQESFLICDDADTVRPLQYAFHRGGTFIKYCFGKEDGVNNLLLDFFSTINTFSGISLQKIHLEDVNLGGANLEDADLREANLVGANLIGANLVGANLGGADLTGVPLVRANLKDAHLVRTSLGGADLRDAHLNGADLKEAYLVRARLDDAHLAGAHLEDAHLEESRFGGADLKGADFKGADLRGADLVGADLRGADFRGAHLEDTNLIGANLIGANLVRAYLKDTRLGGVDLKRADLRGADLREADLGGADLRGVDLIRACLQGAHLSGAHLEDANLVRASLVGADLSDANLLGAKLDGADLLGANLEGSNVSGTILEDKADELGAVVMEIGEFRSHIREKYDP